MSEVRDRPFGEEETSFSSGSRRRIYNLEPTVAMVERFKAAWEAENAKQAAQGATDRPLPGHSGARTRAGLRAALNPAVEDAGCGASLLSWHRDPETRQPVADSSQHCPLTSDHHGSHITPDGLHVWDDDPDEDEW